MSTSDRPKAPHAQTFCVGSVKTEARRLRMLSEWNISTMESVRNAMVMPSMPAWSLAMASARGTQVLMTNANTVTAVEGNIKLPAGISFVTNAKGKPVVEGNEERAEDYNLSCEIQSDGSMTFAQYSDDGYDYEGNSGHIFTFTITADANATPGTYDVLLSGVVLSIGGTGYEIPNRNSSLTVTSGETIYTILDETSTAVPEATTTAVDIKVLRTIKTNEWNTICLPFAMTGAQVTTAFGSDVQLADFIDYDVNDDATLLTVNFNMINPTDGMEANYPYLIKISKPQNMTEFTAKAVIEPAEDDAVVEYDNGKSGSRRQVYGTFKGTYIQEISTKSKQQILVDFTVLGIKSRCLQDKRGIPPALPPSGPALPW